MECSDHTLSPAKLSGPKIMIPTNLKGPGFLDISYSIQRLTINLSYRNILESKEGILIIP